jgi:hypothetical protein
MDAFQLFQFKYTRFVAFRYLKPLWGFSLHIVSGLEDLVSPLE